MSASTATRPSAGGGTWRRVVGVFAILFGLASVVQGGRTLFGADTGEGQYVPFVLAFNFGAGFAYVVAGALIIAGRRSALWLARVLGLATLLVFAALGLHVLQGKPYEAKTVGVMVFRSLFWTLQGFVVLPRLLGERRSA